MGHQLDFIVENSLLLKYYDKKDLEIHRKRIHENIVKLFLADFEKLEKEMLIMGENAEIKHTPLRHEDLYFASKRYLSSLIGL